MSDLPDALAQEDRRRRIKAALRLLPLLGLGLIAVPLLWRVRGAWEASDVLVYLFGVWIGLILLGAVLAHALRYASASGGADEL